MYFPKPEKNLYYFTQIPLSLIETIFFLNFSLSRTRAISVKATFHVHNVVPRWRKPVSNVIELRYILIIYIMNTLKTDPNIAGGKGYSKLDCVLLMYAALM